jgi:hypothetical protein
MDEIFLSDGYKAIFMDDGIILKNPRGYAKLKKFTHKWTQHVTEYGDNNGNRFEISGESLIEGRPSDVGDRIWNYIFEGLTTPIKIKLIKQCDEFLAKK